MADRRRRFAPLLLVIALAGPVISSPASAITPSRGGCTAVRSVPKSTNELITVVAPSQRATRAMVTLRRRQGACFVSDGTPFGAWVGVRGLSVHHVEGDLTTPIGTFALESTIYGIDPNPGVHLQFHRLVCGDWWDEASSSPRYNEFVHVPCGSDPSFATASEALWTEAPAYSAFAVVRYNTGPTVPGRGSGIFIHQSLGHATAGCISLERPDLLALLRFLTAGGHPRIVISVA